MPGQSAHALATARVVYSGDAYPDDMEIFEAVSGLGCVEARPKLAPEHVPSAADMDFEDSTGCCPGTSW